MSPMPIQAIAFDLDGTLVDSLPDLTIAANAVRQHFELAALPEAAIRCFVGDGAAMLVARTLAGDSQATPYDHPQHALAMTVFAEAYLACVSAHTELYPGVLAALQALHAKGLPLAVITNKPLQFTEPLLQAVGIATYFQQVWGGDSLTEKKPSPSPLLACAEGFGLDPAAMLMVGDSKNDVLAARAAGCPVVAVDYGYAADVDALAADQVVSSLTELLALLPD